MTPIQQEFAGRLPSQPPAGLSPKAWQLLTQHVNEGKSYEQVARHHGVLPEDAERMVRAAADRLRQLDG